jgi:hypothetical protein
MLRIAFGTFVFKHRNLLVLVLELLQSLGIFQDMSQIVTVSLFVSVTLHAQS